MKRNLDELITLAHHKNQAAMNEIISIFSVQLKSYKYQLNGEDTSQDLKLLIIEIVNKIDLEKFNKKTDKVFMSYISKSLLHEKFKLYKKNKEKKEHEEYFSEGYEIPYDKNDYSNILLKHSLDYLSNEEMSVIYYIYFIGYTVKMVSIKNHLSIYRIYAIRKRALKKIKEQMYTYLKKKGS
ncbi:hypothetical protein [Pectinatus sottacetonis]|uniref:hypothetical protein n=1 Tax=Pectinatus sottacetonis TaxID=1002795 RepID=UPI0018C78FD5|nr:hypothetical protein [Pectinatus sottacetonis]